MTEYNVIYTPQGPKETAKELPFNGYYQRPLRNILYLAESRQTFLSLACDSCYALTFACFNQ